jgi:hypothetical protein
MALACEHDRAVGHFSIGAANAPSGAMAAANKLNHEMNTRAGIIFMISPKKLLRATTDPSLRDGILVTKRML